MAAGELACVAISLWEIAVLFRKKRPVLLAGYTPISCMEDIIKALGLKILPLTPAIAGLAESGIVAHKDPGDRLVLPQRPWSAECGLLPLMKNCAQPRDCIVSGKALHTLIAGNSENPGRYL